MQRKKSREEVLGQAYLNRRDIQKLLALPYRQASKIYDHAMEIDKEKLKYRIYDTKVRMQSVLEVSGVSLSMLTRQIQTETERKKPNDQS